MKKFTSMFKDKGRSNSQDDTPPPEGDTPEGAASRGVRLFCESGSTNNSGEEILHLPAIVEASESSPQAAAAAAYQIRKFLARENFTRPHVQYNAIMLIRILSDNPGKTFTRNLDGKFVAAVKELLRHGRDQSVQQLLRETLDALEIKVREDQHLQMLVAMWRKEKGAGATMMASQPRNLNAPGWNGGVQGYPNGGGQGGNYFARPHKNRGLPSPEELAGRVEEAKTSAKLLQQLIMSTPPEELLTNELVKEFAERCQSAQRSMQDYINATDPPPDDNTLQTLIETSEQLSLASSKHQRAILGARRTHSNPNIDAPSPPAPNSGIYTPPAGPPPQQLVNPSLPAQAGYGSGYMPPPGPPPQQLGNNSGYIPPPTTNSGYIPPANSGYQPPQGLPPALVPQNISRRPLNPQPPTQLRSDDPFSDEHAQQPFVEPSHYGPQGSAPPVPPPRRTDAPQLPAINHDRSPVDYDHDNEYSPIASRDDPATSRNPYHQASTQNSNTTGPSPYNTSARPESNSYDHYSDVSSVEERRDDAKDLRKSAGSPQSYHPGFQSTPSYMHRQESATEHLTMRGAASPPPARSGGITEENEGGSGGQSTMYRY